MEKKLGKIKKAVLPVAGFGTRFLPATRAQPKEMLPVVDKPVVQYIIEECIESGIEEIIFITGRNKRAIEDHFDSMPELEDVLVKRGLFNEIKSFENLREKIDIIYIRQDRQLGNGHALLCAKKIIKDEPFIFCNADDLIFSPIPAMKQMITEYEKNEIVEEVVGVIEVPPDQIEKCGVVEPVHDEKDPQKIFEIAAIVEKPKLSEAPSNYANPGRYILTPDVFGYLKKASPTKKGEIILAEAIQGMLKDGKIIFGYELEGEWLECGKKEDWLKSNLFLCLKHPEYGPILKTFLKKGI